MEEYKETREEANKQKLFLGSILTGLPTDYALVHFYHFQQAETAAPDRNPRKQPSPLGGWTVDSSKRRELGKQSNKINMDEGFWKYHFIGHMLEQWNEILQTATIPKKALYDKKQPNELFKIIDEMHGRENKKKSIIETDLYG